MKEKVVSLLQVVPVWYPEQGRRHPDHSTKVGFLTPYDHSSCSEVFECFRERFYHLTGL